jgi:hypothetical protein
MFKRILFHASPGVATSFAAKAAAFHRHLPPFDVKPFAENKALRYFSACPVKNVSEGLPGDLHVFRRMLMIEPLQICQPKGFEFIQVQSEYVLLLEFPLLSLREKGS